MIIHHPEFHMLVGALLPFTQCMLQEHEEFLPLGACVQSGDVVILPPFATPPATVPEWLQAVRDALRRQAAVAACAAVAHCVDVRLTDTRDGTTFDAVQLLFEHRSGEALEAFFPYRRQDGDCQFGQPMIRIGIASLFPEAKRSYLN